jgi:exodeoxyribonuclease V beta subunit
MNAAIVGEPRAPAAASGDEGAAGAGVPGFKAAPFGLSEIRDAEIHLRGRRQSSYSSLAHGKKAALFRPEKERIREEDEPDAPAEDAAPIEKPILPRGKYTGEALHEVLETFDFALAARCDGPKTLLEADEGAVRAAIEKALKRHRVWNGDDGRSVEVARIIWNALRCEIPDPAAPGETFRLCDIPASDRMSESEYHFTFARDGTVFPDREHVDGTVIGYIDLVFRRRGRFYILDWKSNTLPSYDRESCNSSMEENKYTLQAALYSMAVGKALQGFAARGERAVVAGAIYVFLRGAKAGRTDGVWTIDREGTDRACKNGKGGDVIAGLLSREDGEGDE